MPETRARDLANIAGAGATSSTVAYHETARSVTLPAGTGDTNHVISSNGNGTTTWRATELSPATISISPTEVASNAGGNITFTLTGTNYETSGMTVTFLANSGSNITSGITVTHGTTTSFTVTVARSAFVDANEPYSVKVTKASGLTHTLSDAVRVDNAPSWSTYVGTLSGSPPVVASIMDNVSSATHATLSAVDAEGDTVTYSETTNTLTNAGMTLSSAGAITGTPTAVSSDTNYDFTARATSTGDGGGTTKTTDQNFRFTITNFVPRLFSGKIYEATDTTTHSLDFPETNPSLQPDLLWFKSRDNANNHALYDSLRGVNSALSPDVADTPNTTATSSQDLVSFDSDGFTVGPHASGTMGSVNEIYNSNGSKVAWGWQAGGAPTATNTNVNNGSAPTGAMTANSVSVNGTLQSSYTPSGSPSIYPKKMSVNTDGGFSIINYTPNGTAGDTIAHGLSSAPEMIIVKDVSAANNWIVYHTSLGATRYLLLDDNTTGGTNINRWYNTAPSSSVVTLGVSGHVNGPGTEYMMYCWHSVSGLSAFGSFNWSSSGDYTVSNLSFQPRFVMIKCEGISSSWLMWDSFRGFGSTANYFKADTSDTELTGSSNKGCVVTSSSFTIGSTLRENSTWVYMAFA